MNGASRQLVTSSTPPVAEYGTAVSERCHIVKEDGTLTECPPQLSAAQTVLVNCASPVPTPKKDIDSTGHASISVGSSEARSPGEPIEGLRLCHLCKWPNFDGYGFALKADRNRNGQFVASVDRGSPAHLGGLRKKDRIVEDSSRASITSHAPITLQHESAAAEHTKYVWAVKPLSQSMPLLANQPMTIASEFRRCDDEATSHRNNRARQQPVKSECRDTAKPSPKLYTIQEAPSPPTTAATTFMTSQLRASAEPCDNGSPPRCHTRNAADYFPAFDESAAINSTQFTPTHSGSPEDGNSLYDSPLRAAPSTVAQHTHPPSAPGLTGYASSQPCGPFCPAQRWLSMSFQAPYVPLEPVRQQERTTTYAPGYSDFLSMYSGYASSSPLNGATETTAVFQTLSEPHGAGADVEASRRSATGRPAELREYTRPRRASGQHSQFDSCVLRRKRDGRIGQERPG
ncbi:hypothetical protein HPB50_016794 [Hyalomma asiaticum]|uniref:Uncharacterized protein n=1 Tax=Hyalomma asiaticum TaxID=266040 RepID=A0ACB7SI23_HYAAI|nr:hypothetical protein HPB50_016794 [Hyalomma asiaticum]